MEIWKNEDQEKWTSGKKGNWTLGKMVFGGKNIRKNGNLEIQICKYANLEKGKLRKMKI